MLTKTGIFFTSRPIMQESIKTIAFNKLYKDFDNPIKKMIQIIEKLILSDTGKIK